MNHIDYARLVFAMRDVQKKYFRTRLREHLEESKRLERQVDEQTALLLNQPPKTLFDAEVQYEQA